MKKKKKAYKEFDIPKSSLPDAVKKIFRSLGYKPINEKNKKD